MSVTSPSDAEKTIVVTGASDGIGAAAARQLAKAGHRVVLVGRSLDKTKAVAAQVGTEEWFTADYAKLDDVRRLAAKLREACPRIDVLCNNAGGMFPGPVRTVDGFERTFQVDYLAGFLLTHLLLDRLLEAGATVVNTASIGAKLFGQLDLDNLNQFEGFAQDRAYGNAKLADIMHATALHQRYHGQGLSAVAYHPGVIGTNFGANAGGFMGWVYRTVGRRVMPRPATGGANLAFFAAGVPGQDWQSGQYYNNHRRVGRTHAQAYDQAMIDGLWDRTVNLLGLD
ncbi:MAG: SDR family NAD(P)-dependent oxidoreductase [Bifidobacteriaceae bacterium]|jgi:NAD(P)-dependent dehydrogenase (short-subunit alcohol dehydrogenase family)|nr:SDR family NAD(P)-dependent oxidoreductase [Bifidobacteriaceae bacterium]